MPNRYLIKGALRGLEFLLERGDTALNCSVCGNPLYIGRVVFRCYCGVYTHSHCWEKHILKSHKPHFTIGSIRQDGRFEPRKEAAMGVQPPTQKIGLN